MKGKNEYPKEWKVIHWQAYTRANWTCEHCGMTFTPGSTKATSATNANGQPVILTIHHLDGDRANNDWHNLLAVCQGCHLHIQARWQPGWALPPEWENGPPTWLTKRHLPYLYRLRLPGV